MYTQSVTLIKTGYANEIHASTAMMEHIPSEMFTIIERLKSEGKLAKVEQVYDTATGEYTFTRYWDTLQSYLDFLNEVMPYDATIREALVANGWVLQY